MKGLSAKLKRLLRSVIATVSSKHEMLALLRNPLYSNAIYIILANAANALCGFIFWMVVAHCYTEDDIGLAAGVLSAASLLTMISGMGLGSGLIRFLGTSKNPSALLNSVFTAVGLASLAAALVFLLGLGHWWSKDLVFIRGNAIYLIVFLLVIPAAGLFGLTDQAFIAGRRAGFILAKNLIFNALRLALPALLAVILHSFGIFASWGTAMLVAFLVGAFFFLPRARAGYRLSFRFDRKAVKEVLRFSFANYIGDIFGAAPILILQSSIILSMMDPKSNAYFSIAWAIGGMLSMIPAAMATSLFAEGSNDEARLEQHMLRSLKMVFLVLIPVVLLVVALADQLLLLFGSKYSQNGADLLRLLAVSSIPGAVNSIYFSAKRVQRHMEGIILSAILSAVIMLGLSILLLPSAGIIAVGIASLVCQVVITLAIMLEWGTRRWKG